jgi:hypothetical protein
VTPPKELESDVERVLDGTHSGARELALAGGLERVRA